VVDWLAFLVMDVVGGRAGKVELSYFHRYQLIIRRGSKPWFDFAHEGWKVDRYV
jgi:hypothetical protein